MKKINLLSFIALAIASSQTTYAMTVLIGGAVGNGDFEVNSRGVAGDLNTWVVNGTAAVTTFQTSDPTNDGFSLSVGTENDGTTQAYYQNTGYAVAASDTFDLSFEAGPRFRWDATDQIEFNLFTTSDNSISGTQTVIATFNADGFAHITNPDRVFGSFSAPQSTALAANVGQQLFIGISGSNQSNEFARVDDLVLSVTSIPEPSAVALLGFGLVGLVGRRRRSC